MGERKSNKIPGKPSNTLGPIRAQGLGDIEPELKIDESATYEEAGPTITRQGRDGIDKSRAGGRGSKASNDMGPGAPQAIYDLAPEIHADAKKERPKGETRPCTECGWPVEVRAHVCTKCGFDKRTGAARATQVGEEDKPEPLPDTRFQTYMHDPLLSRRAWVKAIGLMVGGLVVLAFSASVLGGVAARVAPVGTPAPSSITIYAQYLGKLFVTLAVVSGLYVASCYIFLDYLGPFVLAVLRLGAALACANAAQSVVELIILLSPNFFFIGLILGALAGIITFLALFTDLLDTEYQEGILFTGLVFFAKIVLAITVYPAITR